MENGGKNGTVCFDIADFIPCLEGTYVRATAAKKMVAKVYKRLGVSLAA